MAEDRDLELLTAKKMLKLRRQLASQEKKEPLDRELVVSRLVDRGLEVLEAAERAYPQQTEVVIKKLAELVRKKVIDQAISGGDLLALFRTLGMRVRIQTKISVEEHGRLVPLADRLRTE